MRILLDECVDQRFRRELPNHEVASVQEVGWAGKKNGELLGLASGRFDVFITVDRNLYFQQNLTRFAIIILVLSANTNRYADLRHLGPRVLAELPKMKRGELLLIDGKSETK